MRTVSRGEIVATGLNGYRARGQRGRGITDVPVSPWGHICQDRSIRKGVSDGNGPGSVSVSSSCCKNPTDWGLPQPTLTSHSSGGWSPRCWHGQIHGLLRVQTALPHWVSSQLKGGGNSPFLRTQTPCFGLHFQALITSRCPHLLVPSLWGTAFSVWI